jgi:hypothetical protein
MAKIIAKNSGGADFKNLPQGAHFALCNAVIDLGLQPGYQGAKPKHEIYIRWEVPDERIEYTKDGQTVTGPMSIGRRYTLSLNEKATLRTDLENWRGRVFTEQELEGFDTANLVGKACQLMVVHAESKGKTYANIKGVMGVSKDQRERARTAQLENKPIVFSLAEPDPAAWELVPKWLQEKVQSRISESSSAAGRAPASDDAFDDDIPF